MDLSPEHLEKQLGALDITNREAAHYAGVSEATIYRWRSGQTPIPASVVRMLGLMIKVQEMSAMIGISWSEPPEEGQSHG